MSINPPEAGQVLLAKSPLELVVCQLRFMRLLKIAVPDAVAPFQETISGDFPETQKMSQIEIKISPGEAEPPERGTAWRFSDEEGKWVVTLAPDFLALEARAYTNFDDFSKRFEAVLAALMNDIAPTKQTRLGLRYVNVLKNEERKTVDDWRSVLRSELLGAAGADVFNDVDVMTQQVRTAQGDCAFAMRVGMQREDDSCRLVLDYDYFDETNKPLDQAGIMAALVEFNEAIYRMFHWSVSPDLIKELEPSDGNS